MNITPPVPPVIPPGMVAPGAMPAVAPFSEFPASQIFGVAPLPRRVGRVPSLFLNPFFYVAFLLAVAGLLFIHHLLGGEEFLP